VISTTPFYQRILAEKYPYVPPEDQPRLRQPPASLLAQLEPGDPDTDRFLAVCRAHGAAYVFHHHRLVTPFLAEPAATATPERLAKLTASSPHSMSCSPASPDSSTSAPPATGPAPHTPIGPSAHRTG